MTIHIAASYADTDVDDLEVVPDRPETPAQRAKRQARHKKGPKKKLRDHNPGWNSRHYLTERVWRKETEVVRARVQPEVLEMYRKPLKPVGVR